MKIKKIEVNNLKAISSQSADFNGCSAIISAGNDKGKSTLLKGLIDRFRGEKPEIIVREGQEKGNSLMELTDGSKIEWRFTEKSESFSYTTPEGIKMTTGVLKAISLKYFGVKFDIDKFLNSSPSQQNKSLGLLVGVDFTEIDSRYKLAYDLRTEAKRDLDTIIFNAVDEPEKMIEPDVSLFKEQLAAIQQNNDKLKTNWKVNEDKRMDSVNQFNNEQIELENQRNLSKNKLEILTSFNDTIFKDFIDFEGASKAFNEIPENRPRKNYTELPEPEYESTNEIQAKIDNANIEIGRFESYGDNLKSYELWIKKGKEARTYHETCNANVKKIEQEKKDLISKAKIPKEFQFTNEGVLYKNLPLSSNQLSSSAKYIAALKLGAMALGKLKTMHFDASFLDKNSLEEIQKWAEKNDLQLLIERPDFDAGEIKYEIIDNSK